MKKILTFDVGTTNSRIRIWIEDKISEDIKLPFGIKDTSLVLEKKLFESVENIKQKYGEIDSIIASGMITSNLGLCEVPHVEVPVTIEKLASKVCLKELFGIPTFYIPGIKTLEKIENLNFNDVIRGEEVEVFGLFKILDINKKSLIILPGTHNKFILVTPNKEIVDFTTTISGELLYNLTNNTILKNSLDSSFCKKINYKFLEMGFEHSKKRGFGKTLFSLRSLDIFNNVTIDEKTSYLLGTVIQNDIETLYLNQLIEKSESIICAGSGIFPKAFGYIMKNIEKKEVLYIENGILSALGALEIVNKIN